VEVFDAVVIDVIAFIVEVVAVIMLVLLVVLVVLLLVLVLVVVVLIVVIFSESAKLSRSTAPTGPSHHCSPPNMLARPRCIT
jgi:hypothetical protein